MNPNLIILTAAAIGLIVNTLAVIGVAVKGGRLLGQMEEGLKNFSGDVERLTAEVHVLARSSGDNANTIARTVAQLDALERRVERLEDQQDNTPSRGR